MSAPAAACDSAARTSCSTVGSLAISSSDDDPAVAVRGVLAQAHVGDDEQARHLALERADRGLHRRFRVVGAGADRVFGSGSPKSSTPGMPSALAAAASLHRLVDRELEHAGHRRRLRAAALRRWHTNSG